MANWIHECNISCSSWFLIKWLRHTSIDGCYHVGARSFRSNPRLELAFRKDGARCRPQWNNVIFVLIQTRRCLVLTVNGFHLLAARAHFLHRNMQIRKQQSPLETRLTCDSSVAATMSAPSSGCPLYSPAGSLRAAFHGRKSPPARVIGIKESAGWVRMRKTSPVFYFFFFPRDHRVHFPLRQVVIP